MEFEKSVNFLFRICKVQFSIKLSKLFDVFSFYRVLHMFALFKLLIFVNQIYIIIILRNVTFYRGFVMNLVIDCVNGAFLFQMTGIPYKQIWARKKK